MTIILKEKTQPTHRTKLVAGEVNLNLNKIEKGLYITYHKNTRRPKKEEDKNSPILLLKNLSSPTL